MKKHLRIDQQVFRFDIAMDDVWSMAECDAFNHLIGKESEAFGLRKTVKGQSEFKNQRCFDATKDHSYS